MMLPLAVALALHTCAPAVGVQTMAAIIEQESGWHPYALNDNTTRVSVEPGTAIEAYVLANAWIARGDSVDVGYAGINSGNFASHHVTLWQVLDPCVNLRVSQEILLADYAHALRYYPAGDVALAHALERYNSGSLHGAPHYALSVLTKAESVAVVEAAAAPPPLTAPTAALRKPATAHGAQQPHMARLETGAASRSIAGLMQSLRLTAEEHSPR